MNVYECLENGAINELINFSFDEVKRVFNRCAYYVPEACEDQFVKEATAVKTWYQEELKKIEKYKQEEYKDLLGLGEDIPEYDTPEYMEKGINVQTKPDRKADRTSLEKTRRICKPCPRGSIAYSSSLPPRTHLCCQ